MASPPRPGRAAVAKDRRLRARSLLPLPATSIASRGLEEEEPNRRPRSRMSGNLLTTSRVKARP